MRIIMLIFIFFALGGLFIISNNSLYLKDKEDASKFVSSYYEWLDKMYISAGKVTGLITKTNWLPENNLTK